MKSFLLSLLFFPVFISSSIASNFLGEVTGFSSYGNVENSIRDNKLQMQDKCKDLGGREVQEISHTIKEENPPKENSTFGITYINNSKGQCVS